MNTNYYRSRLALSQAFLVFINEVARPSCYVINPSR